MEGRLSRFIGRFRGEPQEDMPVITIIVPVEMTQSEHDQWKKETTPREQLQWGETVKASEINDPDLIDGLFALAPSVTVGQTILPWNGTVDMEISRTRTMNDAIRSHFDQPSQEEIDREREELEAFVAGR